MDWNVMTPRQIFDAIMTRPKLVAGPWEPPFVDSGGVERWPACRKTPDGMTLVWERAEDEGRVTVHASALSHLSFYADARACASRAEADEVLRAAGYIIVEPVP